MGIHVRSLVVLATLAFAGVASANTLTTTYVGGNSENGIMFDIVANQPIIATAFSVNEVAVGTQTIAIYGRSGTHVGFEDSAAGWTLLGTASVTSAGLGSPTAIPISLNVAVNAGQRFAFYVTNTNGVSRVGYTDGTGVGNIFVQDADVEILEGTGKAYPFGADFRPRVPNVTLTYALGATGLPTLSVGSLALLVLLLLGGALAFRRHLR